MDAAESVRTPFNIIVRRFEKVPSTLIYDNMCNFHKFVLKREPARFKNTTFMVDRLHFHRGHVGCTDGYGMDTYKANNVIKNINSQANEQANSKLRLLSTQAAYMSPENVIQHTKVFLALRNMDKICDLESTGKFSLSSLRQ